MGAELVFGVDRLDPAAAGDSARPSGVTLVGQHDVPRDGPVAAGVDVGRVEAVEGRGIPSGQGLDKGIEARRVEHGQLGHLGGVLKWGKLLEIVVAEVLGGIALQPGAVVIAPGGDMHVGIEAGSDRGRQPERRIVLEVFLRLLEDPNHLARFDFAVAIPVERRFDVGVEAIGRIKEAVDAEGALDEDCRQLLRDIADDAVDGGLGLAVEVGKEFDAIAHDRDRFDGAEN